MASMRDIKRRIKSVNSTQQITKAMNLVASSKLSKAKGRFLDTQPFFKQTQKVIGNLVSSGNLSHPYFNKREEKKVAIIVITGDRGLCGGYNANVCKQALKLAEEKGLENVSVITIGSKAKDFFQHKGIEIMASYRDLSEKPNYEDAAKIGKFLLKAYDEGKIDSIYLAYTVFISTIANEAECIPLLPVSKEDFKSEDNSGLNSTIYEPNEEEVLDYLIPKYIISVLYGAMVESAVSELSSRMTAMDSATENASEIIDDLNLIYNRVRQGAITQEITEIVSGSNALE